MKPSVRPKPSGIPCMRIQKDGDGIRSTPNISVRTRVRTRGGIETADQNHGKANYPVGGNSLINTGTRFGTEDQNYKGTNHYFKASAPININIGTRVKAEDPYHVERNHSVERFTPNSNRNFVVDQNHNEQSLEDMPPTNHDIGNILGSGNQNHDEHLSLRTVSTKNDTRNIFGSGNQNHDKQSVGNIPSNHDVRNIFGLRNQNRDTQSKLRILTNHEIRNRFESGDENHNVTEPQLANGNTRIKNLTTDCVRSGQQNDGMTEQPSEGSSILHSTDKTSADASDNNQVSSVIKRVSAVLKNIKLCKKKITEGNQIFTEAYIILL